MDAFNFALSPCCSHIMHQAPCLATSMTVKHNSPTVSRCKNPRNFQPMFPHLGIFGVISRNYKSSLPYTNFSGLVNRLGRYGILMVDTAWNQAFHWAAGGRLSYRRKRRHADWIPRIAVCSPALRCCCQCEFHWFCPDTATAVRLCRTT